MAHLEARDEPGERNLRRVGHPAEHRFAEKGTAQLHAIESANQFAVMPAFDRMGMTDGVEADRRSLNHAVDPGFLPVGAGEDHRMEGGIAGDGKPAGADSSGE